MSFRAFLTLTWIFNYYYLWRWTLDINEIIESSKFFFSFANEIIIYSLLVVGHLSYLLSWLLGKPAIFWSLCYGINLGFWHITPYSIHEPDQILSLFQLFGLLVLAQPRFAGEAKKFLSHFLGIYYLAAGLKKIPDPAWWRGDFLTKITCWEPVGSPIACDFFENLPRWLLLPMNWFVIILEIGFWPAILLFSSRMIVYWMIIFHLLSGLALDIGDFPIIMWLWNSLLLKPSPKGLSSRIHRILLKTYQSLFNNKPY